MTIRNFALTIGLLYLLLGLLGFFPALVSPPESVTSDNAYGSLVGLFTVNTLHNLVYLFIGVWGLGIYQNHSKSITYTRALASIFGTLTVMGLIPGLNTMFGLMPLFGHNVWLHAATAAGAAYFGYPRALAVPVAAGRAA
jgi:hypothetical protein